MPPRPSAQAAAAVAAASFASLPHALALRVFALLPVDERARCACVCRGWRAIVDDGSLWQRLDLSPAGSVARERVTDLFVHGLAARAAGHAQALHVSECLQLTLWALLAAVMLLGANGGPLRELRVYDRHSFGVFFLAAAAAAAPLLHVLEADVSCFPEDAGRILRNEAPFQLLRVRELYVYFRDLHNNEGYDADPHGAHHGARVHVLAEEVASSAHASLTSLVLMDAVVADADTAEAVVDAALAAQVPSLDFTDCYLCAASAPALARLLRGGSLTGFHIFCGGALLRADRDAVALLADALRESITLTALSLWDVRVFEFPAVLGALVAHPTLRTLVVSENNGNDDVNVTAAGGRALAALIAANAPSLRELLFSSCMLGDAGMGPIADGLAHNTHLQVLDCSYADMSEAFVRTRLLPALLANTSLQRVELEQYDELPAALLQECMDAVAGAR
jgi:hypothetical protein